MLLALRANPRDLDYRVVDRESEITGFGQQVIITNLEFGDLVTVATNQELRAAAMPGVRAGNKSVKTFDTMNQAFPQQKFERAVDDRGRDLFIPGAPIQLGQDIVGAHRLVAGKQDFEHLPAARGQPQIAFGTELRGLRQQLALATAVVVLTKSDTWGLGFERHSVIL